MPFDHHYEVFAKQVAEQTAFAIGNAYDLRRKILMELRQHDAQIQLNTALTSGSIGIWSWDIPTNTVIADKNLAKRFGIGTDEAQAGLPLAAFTDAIHPEDRKWVIERINQSVESKRAFEAEYRIMGSDNKISWVIARGKIETDKDGRPIRFPGVIFDITERKTIEKELARTEEMFKTLFESSIVGVAVQSLDGKIHEANETFLHMLGYTRRDLKSGLTSDMITPPKSRALTANLFRNLKKHGEVDTIEKDYLRKDGSIVPSLMGAVMLQGSSDRFIAFLLDISEQKKLHALNKAKDEFISIASHQLRTPATGVKQYLGMILEGYAGEVNDMQKEILKTAYESNERQLVIVNDLLRVAQADASQISLIKDTINVAQIIQHVINEQAPKFISKNQQIAYTVLPNKSIYARLDPFHIRMAFENLIDNASKYSPKNKPIEIKLRKTTQNIIVSVKDKGVGIRKKDQEKLFKKFSRIDNPLSTVAGGTGLGLYWVHKIVEMHDGEIKVSSEYKKGAEFVITLPIGI